MLEVSANNNNSNSSLCSSNLGMASKTLMEEQDRTCMACREGMDNQCMVSHRCNSHTARGTEEWEILPSSLTMDKEAMDRWGEEWGEWEVWEVWEGWVEWEDMVSHNNHKICGKPDIKDLVIPMGGSDLV